MTFSEFKKLVLDLEQKYGVSVKASAQYKGKSFFIGNQIYIKSIPRTDIMMIQFINGATPKHKVFNLLNADGYITKPYYKSPRQFSYETTYEILCEQFKNKV